MKSNEILKIVLPVAPRTKKNHNQIFKTKNGRRFVKPSPQYEAFERECGLYLQQYRDLNIGYPINLKCEFYQDANRKSDLCGFLQAIQDVLCKYNVLQDDNNRIVGSVDGSRCYVDKENPRIEIDITRKVLND